MQTLKGKHIYLRALEPEDLKLVHSIENDERIWEISQTQTPFSKYIIEDYIKNSHKDIYEIKQLRLAIATMEDRAVGLIDIFDFDFKNRRAGIGLVIKDTTDRGKGYGREAVGLLINYCFSQLNLHQLYCDINEQNEASIKLFKSHGFIIVGMKKDWNLMNGIYQDVYLMQLINENES
ncbi:MAG: GNAT family N-acetyltransferase [Flavobacteriaceae bacterium]|nr:GNAT family N-acetyltransferase [Flavobacteriaceae bacterium]